MNRAALYLAPTAAPIADLVERAFDPAKDMPAMVELICDVNVFDAVDWFPTVASLANEWSPSPGFDPSNDVRLVFDGERLIAAAGHDWRERGGKVVHVIEIWVRPELRRRGLGRQLLAWSEARVRTLVAEKRGGPADLPHVLGIGTATHVLPGVAFAKAFGYELVRYGFTMRRDLAEPIRGAPLPSGIEVRPVTPDQHRQIWDADVEAFLDHWEAGVRHEEDFVRFFNDPDIDTTMWQVAWDGDQVAGAVMNGIYPHENARLGVSLGWLDHVSVRRPWRGRGVASALISRSLAVLRDRGMAFASLGVDAENPTGALGLYEKHGFVVHRTWGTFRKPL
jgi:mycothiol synthase